MLSSHASLERGQIRSFAVHSHGLATVATFEFYGIGAIINHSFAVTH